LTGGCKCFERRPGIALVADGNSPLHNLKLRKEIVRSTSVRIPKELLPLGRTVGAGVCTPND
ncbi:hypothetical protein, partial [Salmonella sp. SAL4436]|uniref:hypothetical protein n=1 Tax=Salmonella sp. SAL4436 TaxID=3159891 RepID=UPI00397D07AC